MKQIRRGAYVMSKHGDMMPRNDMSNIFIRSTGSFFCGFNFNTSLWNNINVAGSIFAVCASFSFAETFMVSSWVSREELIDTIIRRRG